MADTIRNPVEWAADQLRDTAHQLQSMGHTVRGEEAGTVSARPVVRRIEIADLKEALAKGFVDLGACRSDILFIGLIYPVVGLLLAWFAFDHEILPLLFPVVSGMALLTPVVAVGLYEISRRRERGEAVSWTAAVGVIRAPSFGAILMLGLVLCSMFGAWLMTAQAIYDATLGPKPPISLAAFASDVFTTEAGWTLMIVGVGVGFLFAVCVLALSIVSFPLLLDRDVGLGIALWTSIRVVITNPRVSAYWGVIVSAGLILGSIPLFLGLIIILPVLGHATWHLYRCAVER